MYYLKAERLLEAQTAVHTDCILRLTCGITHTATLSKQIILCIS